MNATEYEDLFRFHERKISREEQLANEKLKEELKKKSKKNKMSFLRDEKMFVKRSDYEEIEDGFEPIVSENWKEDYEDFKTRGRNVRPVTVRQRCLRRGEKLIL